jgi:hypothetical protein
MFRLQGIEVQSLTSSETARLLRREEITTDKIHWFVNMARIGAYKIRDPEGVCKAERRTASH